MIKSKMIPTTKEVVNPLPQEPKTRGEVAAQEQIKVFGRVFATNGEPRAPTSRGEVAAQEQMRIVQYDRNPHTFLKFEQLL